MKTIEEKAQAYAERKFQEIAELYQTAPWPEFRAKLTEIYLDGATEALSTQWRDPKEELPELDQPILIREKYRSARTGKYVSHVVEELFVDVDQFSHLERVHSHLSYSITHWMPIPELPKLTE